VIVLDTSVLVGFFLASDAHHSMTVAWFDAWTLRGGDVQIPSLGLVELAGTLRRQQVEQPIIEHTLEQIIRYGKYRVHDLDLVMAQFAATIAFSSSLKGADAVFVALAAWLDLPLVTWDRQQQERGGAFCRTMTPIEAMEENE
jgi:predicted nucleic acid-binding protein